MLYWATAKEAQHCVARGNTERLYLQSLILAWLSESDKNRRLTACLVLFELIQLHRHSIRAGKATATQLLESGHAANMVAALRRILDTGSVAVKGANAWCQTARSLL